MSNSQNWMVFCLWYSWPTFKEPFSRGNEWAVASLHIRTQAEYNGKLQSPRHLIGLYGSHIVVSCCIMSTLGKEAYPNGKWKTAFSLARCHSWRRWYSLNWAFKAGYHLASIHLSSLVSFLLKLHKSENASKIDKWRTVFLWNISKWLINVYIVTKPTHRVYFPGVKNHDKSPTHDISWFSYSRNVLTHGDWAAQWPYLKCCIIDYIEKWQGWVQRTPPLASVKWIIWDTFQAAGRG